MDTLDLTLLTETDFEKLRDKWRELSPDHRSSNTDDGRNFFWVIERDALKFTAERLRFVVVRRKTQMTLNVEVGQSTEQHAQTWLPLSDLPTDPEIFYTQCYALIKLTDYRRGMGLLAKNKDFIAEQWRNFVSCLAAPDRGTFGDQEDYDR